MSEAECRMEVRHFPIRVHLREEMKERGWDYIALAQHSGLLATEVHRVMETDQPIPDHIFPKLSRAFGVGDDFFRRLDGSYRAWCRHRKLTEKGQMDDTGRTGGGPQGD